MAPSRSRIRGGVLVVALAVLVLLVLLWWWSFAGPGRQRFRETLPLPPSASDAPSR